MARHLVLGGAGFIGSHLCESLLSLGHQVTALDNLFTGRIGNLPKGVVFRHHDVCEPFHHEVDVVWNLACPASPVYYRKNPVRTIKTSVQGMVHALECARDCGATLILASTSEVYGDPTVHPQPETYLGNVNTLGPRACYDESKRCAESLAVSWSDQYGTDVRIARIFNVYGPRLASGDGRMLPNFITQALKGQRLTVYGDGLQTRSLCYVTDMVDGLLALAAYKSHLYKGVPLCNLGNPDERSVLSIARDVLVTCGRAPEDVVFSPLPKDDPKKRCPDISRAREMLKWQPCVDYVDGLARTLEWFRGEE